MNKTVKRLEKIEQELGAGAGDEAVTKAYIVRCTAPGQREPDPDEEKAIERAIQLEIENRTRADGRRPEWVQVWPPRGSLVYNVRPAAGADRIHTDDVEPDLETVPKP